MKAPITLPKSEPAKGFTLIEILVAMSIFSIAVLGFAMGTIAIVQGNQKSYNVAIANALAQDKLEELKARPASFASGGPVTDTISGQTFSRSWTVTANSPISGMHKIDVTVTWTDYKSNSITLSSAING
jgi:prepilin-type N-terminal cleavage/methylation domain-containing protein